MGKIREIAGAGAPMPGFDDGMVNVAGPIRAMAESPVNEAMGARADGARGGGNRRNGCRERRPVAGVGAISLGIPRPRAGGCFPEGPIGRYSRAGTPSVAAAVPETAADGVPAGKAERAARTMGMGRMGAGRVPGICPSPDESVADLRGRGPSDATCPHIRLDAAHIECGDAGRVRPTAPVAAVGAGPGGYGRRAGHPEGRARRARPRAREGALPTHRRLDRALPPQGGRGAGRGRADAPAHPDLPCGHRVGLRTDDVRGRADRGPRRRSRVVQVLPGGKSPIGMMGAAFSEMDGDRAGRRRFGDDPVGGAVEGAEVNGPAHAYGGAAAEHAAGIIALAAADNPIPGGKAAQHALE